MKKTLFLTTKSILVAFSFIAVCAFSTLLLGAHTGPATNDQMSGQTEAQGDTKKKDDPPTCTLETVKGRYLFGGWGTLLPPAAGVTQQSLSAAAGYHIFNGDGTGTDIVTVRLNGVTVLENLVAPFNYTVNADCTGAYTVPSGPSFGMFIAPTGEELIIIPTDPGSVGVLGPSRRVSRK